MDLSNFLLFKFFRKKFGIQFFLDVIRQYYAVPVALCEEDGQAVRAALMEIIKYYIYKDLNIKEVCVIIAYIASVGQEHLILEILELLLSQMNSRNCLDQLFLLMHEQQTAELCYALLTDRKYGTRLQSTVIKVSFSRLLFGQTYSSYTGIVLNQTIEQFSLHFLSKKIAKFPLTFSAEFQFLSCLSNTKRVSKKHKLAVRLHDPKVVCQTLYPGLINEMLPLELDTDNILAMIDLMLSVDAGHGYCGALKLIYHLSESNIALKLAIAQKLLHVLFTKLNSASHIAKQIGWQESITRLLVRKHITTNFTVDGSYVLAKDIQDQTFEDGGVEFAMDMLTFDESNMEISSQSSSQNVLLNELQANITEAANVIEHEIKEMAETVSGKVAGNFSTMYSMIRQKTSDFQETFESLTSGSTLTDKQKSSATMSTISSNSTSDDNLSIKSNKTAADKSITHVDSIESDSMTHSENPSVAEKRESVHGQEGELIPDGSVSEEEQLIYLVTSILYTILRDGIEKTGGDSWKERGQIIACINLLGLNNELYCSHLTLRLKLFEYGAQDSLNNLSVATSQQDHIDQDIAAQLLRMIYDLVYLDPNEDEEKKCSIKLLEGILGIMGTKNSYEHYKSEFVTNLDIFLGIF